MTVLQALPGVHRSGEALSLQGNVCVGLGAR